MCEIPTSLQKFNLIYVLECKSWFGLYKIGSTQDINSRIQTLQTGNPYPIKLLRMYYINKDCYEIDCFIRKNFKYSVYFGGGIEFYKKFELIELETFFKENNIEFDFQDTLPHKIPTIKDVVKDIKTQDKNIKKCKKQYSKIEFVDSVFIPDNIIIRRFGSKNITNYEKSKKYEKENGEFLWATKNKKEWESTDLNCNCYFFFSLRSKNSGEDKFFIMEIINRIEDENIAYKLWNEKRYKYIYKLKNLGKEINLCYKEINKIVGWKPGDTWINSKVVITKKNIEQLKEIINKVF